MNRVKLTSLICGGMISLAGNSALAQQPSSSTPGTGTSIGADQSSSGHSAYGHWPHSGQSVRLSDLQNASVQTSDGKTIGTIRDFTVDPQSGRIQYALLSLSSSTSPLPGAASSSSADTSTSGRETVPSSRSSVSGATGTTPGSSVSGANAYTPAGKLVPVPWELFTQSWSANKGFSGTTGSTAGMRSLALNIDESKLISAPSIDLTNPAELQQPTFEQRVYTYYGVNRMSGAGTSGSSISGQGSSTRDSSGAKGGSNDLNK